MCAPPSSGNATGMTVLTMVLSSPARMMVNNTPSKTSTPLCPEESCDRIVHIARGAAHCKTATTLVLRGRF